MAFCTSCGAKCEDGLKFCASCGKPLQASASQSEAGSQSGTQTAAMPKSVNVGQIRKCPACGASVDSFQTRCSSCGHEFNTIKDEEAVSNFFKKLDELTQKEYEANKAREGKAKIKTKVSKPVAICQAIAIVSLVLILLKVTGISDTILDGLGLRELIGISSSSSSYNVSGTYALAGSAELASITFSGNNFALSAGDEIFSGTYRVSGNSLILTLSDGDVMNMTISDSNTLRDRDGDYWRR